MTVYKLVAQYRDGSCHPLFIDRKRAFTFGEWMHCRNVPIKGFALRSADDSEQIGGWHCTFRTLAPHLAEELKSGEKRVWIECEAKGLTKRYERPESQGGAWVLVEWLRPIRVIGWDEVRRMQCHYLSEQKRS